MGKWVLFSLIVLLPWWRHQMETFSVSLAIFAGISSVPCEFPTQRPVTRSFDVYFDLRLNKRLCKQWWGWWFETLLCPLWRHSNDDVSDYSMHASVQSWHCGEKIGWNYCSGAAYFYSAVYVLSIAESHDKYSNVQKTSIMTIEIMCYELCIICRVG